MNVRYGTYYGQNHVRTQRVIKIWNQPRSKTHHISQTPTTKHSKDDRLKFNTHNGPTDINTMTEIMQLSFQCDADLGGNLDNGH